MIADLDTAYFDPNSIAVPEGPDVEFPRTQDHPHSYHLLHQLQENVPADFADYSCDISNDHPTVEKAIDGDPRNTSNNRVMPNFVDGQASSWNSNQPGLLQDMLQQLVADQAQMQNGTATQKSSGEVPLMPPPDHLGFFHLFPSARSSSSTSPPWPSSSLLPKPPLSYANPNASAASSVLYDPLFHLRNLQPQPPPMGELLYPYAGLAHEDNNGGEFAVNGEGGMTTTAAMMMMMYGEDEGVLEMMEGGNRVKIGKRRGGNKLTKHFATERDRRTQLNEKYVALRDLIPNPTKFDRASIVGDAIDYIKELLVTVNELNLLLERKRWGRERRCKRRRVAVDEEVEEEDAAVDGGESSITAVTPPGDPADRSFNGALRSSCLQRKSKATEVDVRIVNDEVTIKLVQRKKINCLLLMTRVLSELQLDLHHVSGGHIGEHYSFLLTSKIFEGSTVYASAIASKVIEVVDRQYYAAAAAPPPPSSCSY
ncbi:transcription factor bHLH91-like [Rhodamnia argentea]|uniref:Transcription factor bHLH91-like n=1 Tax=Rhodamnia argentea TaxID=178133 RepID=A0A8B8QH78_9MYRT|nr:transcription factor bHLH91-like [Rhodamnia argentea]